MLDEGTLTEDEDRELRAEVVSEIERAIETAESAPDPTPESALRHVFLENDGGG